MEADCGVQEDDGFILSSQATAAARRISLISVNSDGRWVCNKTEKAVRPKMLDAE